MEHAALRPRALAPHLGRRALQKVNFECSLDGYLKVSFMALPGQTHAMSIAIMQECFVMCLSLGILNRARGR